MSPNIREVKFCAIPKIKSEFLSVAAADLFKKTRFRGFFYEISIACYTP
jgi:hypothetical protein